MRDRHEEDLLAHVEQNPSTSTRRAARRFGLSPSVVWRVWKRNGLSPYHRTKVHKLYDRDHEPRRDFSEWYREQVVANPDFSSLVMFTDESKFNQDGIFNSKNNICWTNGNTHEVYEQGREDKFSVNVWAGILGDQLIGPYILPDNLNGRSYQFFLTEVLPELLENVPLDVRNNMWLQQDGAPPHYARVARNYLDQAYPDRWIGRLGPIRWPARSLDLNPLDFFFWGRMKELVYSTPVVDQMDLVARIAVAAQQIQDTVGIFASVREGMLRRCNACIEANGENFEHLL